MKDLNNYIIEKIIISKDTKIQYSTKPEEYFVEKFGLNLVGYDSTSHTYEMSEEFKKEIIKKIEYDDNDFKKKLNNYILTILDVPYEYEFVITYRHPSKNIEIYFNDLDKGYVIDSITIDKNNQKNTLIYNKYNIEKYPKMGGKLFCVLDYIIENNIK